VSNERRAYSKSEENRSSSRATERCGVSISPEATPLGANHLCAALNTFDNLGCASQPTVRSTSISGSEMRIDVFAFISPTLSSNVGLHLQESPSIRGIFVNSLVGFFNSFLTLQDRRGRRRAGSGRLVSVDLFRAAAGSPKLKHLFRDRQVFARPKPPHPSSTTLSPRLQMEARLTYQLVQKIGRGAIAAGSAADSV
jgi:hypothetical protein